MRSGSGTASVYCLSISWFHEMHAFPGENGEYREPISYGLVNFSFNKCKGRYLIGNIEYLLIAFIWVQQKNDK